MEKYGADASDLQRQELQQVRDQIISYETGEGELSKTASAELASLKARAAELEEALAGHEAGF